MFKVKTPSRYWESKHRRQKQIANYRGFFNPHEFLGNVTYIYQTKEDDKDLEFLSLFLFFEKFPNVDLHLNG